MAKPDTKTLPESITAPRTDPIYNCHGYLTKVPVGAIEPFIKTFTEPGDVVADFFAGSGMTGLAALRATCRVDRHLSAGSSYRHGLLHQRQSERVPRSGDSGDCKRACGDRRSLCDATP